MNENLAAELDDYRARLAAIHRHLPKLDGQISTELLLPIHIAVSIGYPDPPSEREVKRAQQLEQMMYESDGKRREVRLSDSAHSYMRGYTDARSNGAEGVPLQELKTEGESS